MKSQGISLKIFPRFHGFALDNFMKKNASEHVVFLHAAKKKDDVLEVWQTSDNLTMHSHNLDSQLSIYPHCRIKTWYLYISGFYRSEHLLFLVVSCCKQVFKWTWKSLKLLNSWKKWKLWVSKGNILVKSYELSTYKSFGIVSFHPWSPLWQCFLVGFGPAVRCQLWWQCSPSYSFQVSSVSVVPQPVLCFSPSALSVHRSSSCTRHKISLFISEF